jgi:Ribonuclease G/E
MNHDNTVIGSIKAYEAEQKAKTDPTRAILNERGQRYGKFTEHAEITQQLKKLMHSHALRHGGPLSFDQAEALDMIAHKIGRIVNGDPDYIDSWDDIAGYAVLVADRLRGNSR